MPSGNVQVRESTVAEGDHVKDYLRELISPKSMGPDSLQPNMLGKLSNVFVRTSLKSCGDWGRFLRTVQKQLLHPSS